MHQSPGISVYNDSKSAAPVVIQTIEDVPAVPQRLNDKERSHSTKAREAAAPIVVDVDLDVVGKNHSPISKFNPENLLLQSPAALDSRKVTPEFPT